MAPQNKYKSKKKRNDQDRFKSLDRDSRYRQKRKTEKDIQLDERFENLTKDEEFGTSVHKDVYGKNITDSDNDLVKLYQSQGIKLSRKEVRDIAKEESHERNEQEEQEILDQIQEDLSEGPVYETIADETNRLALANVSWDNIQSDDIIVLFSSFCPPGGSVENVTIYVSNFGKERLAIEATSGPGSILDSYAEEAQSKDKFPKELEHYEAYAIREYEKSRMRYYFAIATFDSPASALSVYAQCDGMDFEGSGDVIDLSFVPDEQNFEGYTVHKVSDKIPALYVPKELGIVNPALSKTKVELQWEKGNAQQRRLMNLAFEGNIDQLDETAFDDLLAPASEEEDIDVSKKYSDLIKEINQREEEAAAIEEFKVKFGDVSGDVTADDAKKLVSGYKTAEKLLGKDNEEAELESQEDTKKSVDHEDDDIESLASLAEANGSGVQTKTFTTKLDSRFASIVEDDDFAIDIENAEFKLNKDINKEIIKRQIAAKRGTKIDEEFSITTKVRRK